LQLLAYWNCRWLAQKISYFPPSQALNRSKLISLDTSIGYLIRVANIDPEIQRQILVQLKAAYPDSVDSQDISFCSHDDAKANIAYLTDKGFVEVTTRLISGGRLIAKITASGLDALKEPPPVSAWGRSWDVPQRPRAGPAMQSGPLQPTPPSPDAWSNNSGEALPPGTRGRIGPAPRAFQPNVFQNDAFQVGRDDPPQDSSDTPLPLRVTADGVLRSTLSTSAGDGTVKIDRAAIERADTLARALSRTVNQEVERIRNERRNDPDADIIIGFLTEIAAVLDQIAASIEEARAAGSPEQKEEKLARASSLAESLAESARGFAVRNHDRVIDFGGNTLFVTLGTSLFTTLFGVPAELAMAAALGLLAIKK
jgi:hypothetical protein